MLLVSLLSPCDPVLIYDTLSFEYDPVYFQFSQVLSYLDTRLSRSEIPDYFLLGLCGFSAEPRVGC